MAAALELHAGAELGEEVERQQLDEHVEADVAVDAEAVRRGVERASAPNCTVFEVIAKYAWQISFGLSPLVSASWSRATLGKPGRRGEPGVQAADREREAGPGPSSPSASPSRR